MTGWVPGRRVDRYEVEGVIAAGGTGLVLQVRHLLLGTTHALKVLHTATTTQRERLLREGRIQASLRHPNIVAVTDVVPLDEGVGLVMDLVRGPDLWAWARRHTPTVPEVDDLAEQLFAALACAHAADVVHRDLKPSNVLVEDRDGALVARVADFGTAVALGEGEPRLTGLGQVMGTPCHMPPEQYKDGLQVDHRADLWALGALLYEVLAGQPAFEATSVLSAYEAATRAEVQPFPPSRDVPLRMERAILAALRPSPEERPPDVGALRALWRGGTPSPTHAWSIEALAAARLARLPEPPRPTIAAVPTPPEPPLAPPPERPAWGRRALLGAALLVAVSAGAAELWRRWALPDPALPDLPADPPPDPPSVPPPVSAPEAQGAGADGSALPDAVRAPPAPTTASLRVVGVQRARLLAEGGASLAPSATLRPGRYTLEVWFDPDAPTRVMSLDLRAGSTRLIRCEQALRVCR